MISRRKFLGTSAVASIAAVLGVPFTVEPAMAALQNPQRMAHGFPFPVYVNATGTKQSLARFVYVNQTQFGSASGARNRSLMGVGQ